jgi:hypothetical protein
MKRVLKYWMLFTWLFSHSSAQTQADTISWKEIKSELRGRIQIKRLGINSAQSDYSPQLVGGNLYFISERIRKAGVQFLDTSDSPEISDMYFSRGRDSVHFSSPVLIKELSSRYHEGPFTANASGNVIYFTGNHHKAINKIFVSTKQRGKWTKPELLSFCEDEFSYCHPTLSPDERIMYFSSDRPGYGGMDIFFSEYRDGAWSSPKNAGRRINSQANEIFPFIAPGPALYFSSNRQGGPGGLDLYRCDLADSTDGPQPLPLPLNSSSDDFGIWVDSGNDRGYFSSNRALATKDDIFFFSVAVPDFSGAKQPVTKSIFCYNFYEETSLGNNDTTNLEFEWDCGDGTKKRGLRTRHCYAAPGNYKVRLNVVEKLSGEVFNNLVEYDLNILTPEKLYISCEDSVRSGDTVRIDCLGSALKGYIISEVFWSFGDSVYNKGWAVKHIYHTPGSYDLELWVHAENTQTGRREKFKIGKKVIVTDPINAE